MELSISLFDDSSVQVTCDVTDRMEDLVRRICEEKNIPHSEEFSLMKLQCNSAPKEWVKEGQLMIEIIPKSDLTEPTEAYWLFHQCLSAFRDESLPIIEMDCAMNLTALIVQYFHGNYNPDHLLPHNEIASLLPPLWQKGKHVKRVNEYHKRLCNITTEKCQYRFICICTSLNEYGFSWFQGLIKQSNYCVQRSFGMGLRGLCCIDERKKEITHLFPIHAISRWTTGSLGVTIDLGNHYSEYIVFECIHKDAINECIIRYIDVTIQVQQTKEATTPMS